MSPVSPESDLARYQHTITQHYYSALSFGIRIIVPNLLELMDIYLLIVSIDNCRFLLPTMWHIQEWEKEV